VARIISIINNFSVLFYLVQLTQIKYNFIYAYVRFLSIYRLSSARRASENICGILSSVFRVFPKAYLLLEPEIATNVSLTPSSYLFT